MRIESATTEIAADEQRLRVFIDDAVRTGMDRLPPEPLLSEQIGVSRGRLRTLLRRAEDEGLIWRHVGKGTFVGQRHLVSGDPALAAAISVDDMMTARLLLEPQLAAEAAIHATPLDISIMESCRNEMSEAECFLHWRRLDEKLHRSVAEATHNALLLMLFDALRAQAKVSLEKRMEEVFGKVTEPMLATESEHLDFIDAIRAHDPGRAERAMRDHIQSVRKQLFGLR